jgi:hypothetical protein
MGTKTLEAGTPTDEGAGRFAGSAPRCGCCPTGVTGGISSSGDPAVGIGGGMLSGAYVPVAAAVVVGRI